VHKQIIRLTVLKKVAGKSRHKPNF